MDSFLLNGFQNLIDSPPIYSIIFFAVLVIFLSIVSGILLYQFIKTLKGLLRSEG